MARSSSRVFSRKLSPTAALLAASTQLHLGDPSFVPDTLQVAKSLPAKSGQCDEDDMEIRVPDTPELSQEVTCPPSANIEPFLTPEKVKTEISSADADPVSPLIARSRGPQSGRKMALVHRSGEYFVILMSKK